MAEAPPHAGETLLTCHSEPAIRDTAKYGRVIVGYCLGYRPSLPPVFVFGNIENRDVLEKRRGWGRGESVVAGGNQDPKLSRTRSLRILECSQTCILEAC
jgi:hypothetical protein